MIWTSASDLRATEGILTLKGMPMQDEEDDEEDDDEGAPKRGQKRLKRSRFVDDIAAVDEEEDDEEEEVGAAVARPSCPHAHAPCLLCHDLCCCPPAGFHLTASKLTHPSFAPIVLFSPGCCVPQPP